MLTPTLQNLARSIQETCSPRITAPPLPTWPALDQAIRGLPKAAIHEWFNSDAFSPKGWSSIAGSCRDTGTPGKRPDDAMTPKGSSWDAARPRRPLQGRTNTPPNTGCAAARQPPAIHDQAFGLKNRLHSPARSSTSRSPLLPWLPPLTPILHLARNTTGTIVWIGRRVWPYPVSCPDLLTRSIFIDAKDLAERAWATDVSLRCPGLTVIADGSAFTMSISRRLQLAAGESGGVGLILRPHSDLSILSAAHTRWLITPLRSTSSPQWQLQLLRCKGAKLPDVTTWTLALHETGTLHLVPDAADRSVPPQEITGAVTA